MVNTKPVERVIEKLIQLDKNLESLKLPHIKPFNTTYLIISSNVLAKLNKGYFESDEKVGKLLVTFAGYYFRTIENHLKGNKLAGAWKQILEHPNLPKLFRLGLAANAHINNDLPLALRDTADDSFKFDYIKLKSVVNLSIDEIAQDLKFEKDLLKYFYKKIMIRETERWREKAWINYLKLVSGTITKKEVEEQAILTFQSLYSRYILQKN